MYYIDENVPHLPFYEGELRKENKIFNPISSNTTLFFLLFFVLSEKMTIFVYLSGERAYLINSTSTYYPPSTSVINLKYMKHWYQFYGTSKANRQQVVDELPMPEDFANIPWGHHICIITKCDRGFDFFDLSDKILSLLKHSPMYLFMRKNKELSQIL